MASRFGEVWSFDVSPEKAVIDHTYHTVLDEECMRARLLCRNSSLGAI